MPYEVHDFSMGLPVRICWLAPGLGAWGSCPDCREPFPLHAATLHPHHAGAPLALGFSFCFVLLGQHRAQNMEDLIHMHWGLQALHL